MSRTLGIALVGLLAALAGCSTGTGGGPSGALTATPVATGASTTVGVASSTLGQHLVDSAGKSLYVLTTDSANTSTCSGGCAAAWPPLTVGAGQTPVAGTGVTAALATMTRDDGTTQVTANGMPLYGFASDTAAGETKGQGVGGVWFLAAPDGLALGAGSGGTPAATGTPPPGGSPGSSSPPDETDDGYGG